MTPGLETLYICRGVAKPTEVITARHPGTFSGRAAILEWQPFVDPVHHYQVYRATSVPVATNQKNLVGSPSRPHFVDPNLPSGTHCDVIQAVDAWGQTSLPSSVKTVTITEPPLYAYQTSSPSQSASGRNNHGCLKAYAGRLRWRSCPCHRADRARPELVTRCGVNQGGEGAQHASDTALTRFVVWLRLRVGFVDR